jgi:hypothetical protein
MPPSGCHRGLLARTISECLLPHLQKNAAMGFLCAERERLRRSGFSGHRVQRVQIGPHKFIFRPEGAPGYAAPPRTS